jgi:DNA/RNA endonuclease G (NUC1)
MRIRNWSAALVALFVATGSCSDRGSMSPLSPQLGPAFYISAADTSGVRISEIHYDNTGTDAGEAIEVSAPAGTVLDKWQLVLYNGAPSSLSVYNTRTLSGTVPATCGARGVLVFNYAVNGIQNGDPDGVALVDSTGAVVEFWSYGGTFTASGGPANGLTSTDFHVKESTTTPVGNSLARTGADTTWTGPAANTFGACNDVPAEVASIRVTPATATVTVGGTQSFIATAFDASSSPISGVTFKWTSDALDVASVGASGVATGLKAGDAHIIAKADNGVTGSASLHVDESPNQAIGPEHINEIHYDNTGGDVGEAIEVEGPAGMTLTGWSIALYNGNGGAVYQTLPLSGLAVQPCSNGRSVAVIPAPGMQNGSPDGLALVNPAGAAIEFLSYEGTMDATSGPASGTSTDIGVAEGDTPTASSLQRDADGTWYGPATSSFGACNPARPANRINFSGRNASDPALPVGFQDQLFATLVDASNATVTTTFTWSSDTPQLASIDANGVVTALAEGTAVLRATAADNTTRTWSLPTRVATASTTAHYDGNAEFGEPADGDASDDFIVRHPQYTASYNKNRNTPNWVSYDIDASAFGPEDRCDCFTFDSSLPASFTRYTTADYTGAGAFHGYGIDRGHLARSFDRTSASLDNARTFLFTNIIPQAADLNQGPWAVMENDLGDFARLQNQEVYVIAGIAGSKGTLKNEGKITIPASVWKVAVIMPRDQGLAQVHDYRDLDVIAVIMPNEPGVRNVPWQTYQTTVDAVEALSGYDLLALLPDRVERDVESGTKPPFANLSAPATWTEGTAVAMSAAGSVDYNGSIASYQWTFGDGTTATGTNVSHVFANDGTFSVRLVVTDNDGLTDETTTTVAVANVAPRINDFAGAELLPGERYSAEISFTDPGADPWTASVSFGDGSSTTPAISGQRFAISHVYATAGTFAVDVSVRDDDATSTARRTVTVLTHAAALRKASGMVEELVADGRMNAGNGSALRAHLDAALRQLDKDNPSSVNQLQSLLNALAAMERTNRIPSADAAALRSLVDRVITSLLSS